MKLLIVEDEKLLSKILTEILKKEKYIVDAVYDGQDGLDYAMTGSYDVILLDIMLPKMNGLEMLKKLRESGDSTPVLMLTAKAELEDKIKGLDCGADDYITKPFQTGELLARVRSILRRKDVFVGDVQTFEDLILDKNTMSIATKAGSIKISSKEYKILDLLMSNPRQIISKEQFIQKIWGYDFNGEYNSVEVYVSFIRRKMKAIKSTVKIKVHRGMGYSMEDTDD